MSERVESANRLDVINLLFNLFSLSSYYLAFFFLVSNSVTGTVDPFGGAGDEIFAVFNKVYIAVMCVVHSLLS